ncbi:hypothetical protein GYMLUDRAFT_737151 [Collybiopsis luxurians FD-317 M1]|uniref:Carboxylic ester hydrolase n=1 Tax=Collybiopsis luxurians FD-317 M1 TaxID=944289 RepID=A0A0D0CQX7_9AGAR|nr:hypothetical protein GYMLUDRAFT_737151 [Collybiopsis luxurians FD-317 M1]
MDKLLDTVAETISQIRLGPGIVKSFFSGLLFAQGVVQSISEFNASCSAIASELSVQNTTVFFSELVPAGSTVYFPDNHPSCGRPSQSVLEDICRVALYVHTSDRSGINLEAWLPRRWTGRFMSTGNGGLAGCIQYEDMAYASALGFATVGANNGHNGTSGQAFLNNLEVVADFAYRSVHTGVVVGKEVSKKFYGKAHTKSYYFGCSSGGRQGLKSVQDFPEDFDGVLAGAPANAFNGLLSWSGRFYAITGPPGSPSFISEQQWVEIVHSDILRQCDMLDGVEDGVIEDPNLCDYKPENLICSSKAKDRSRCLSGEQVKAIRKMFSPLYSPEGEIWYPSQQPGSENKRTSNALYSGKPFPYTADWFRYAVYNNPDLDVTALNMTDWVAAHDMDLFEVDAWKGDLSTFKARNGKLIMWHGQADGEVSPANSERYYNHVSYSMSMPPSELDSFYRFFRISGMDHCRGGDGAWAIGQSLAGTGGVLDEITSHPDSNVLQALVRWVEQGKAPESLLGTRYIKDSKELGIQSSRRHCRYPYRNHYDGIGNSSQPESWSCK